LPDISNWRTDNIKDYGCIFADCLSLKTLPDISKWNINKADNISALFSNCFA